MKDIETGKEITLDVYASIVNENGDRVSMDISTFKREIDTNNEYFSKNPPTADSLPENFSIGDPLENYLFFTYEIRDYDEILRSYPLLYLPKDGLGFRKTIEYFLNKEKIKIN